MVIYSSHTGSAVREFTLGSDFATNCRHILWSGEYNGLCDRILLADDDTIHIHDVTDPKWHACIDKASTTLDKIAKLKFGFTNNEVLVFSDFGFKLTIWSVVTCRGVEMRDPKYNVQCYSFRPRSGHLALLTRAGAHDVLMLLSPENHELIDTVELTTVDAQEVAWSPDGCWLAIRDVASSGHKVMIYTADGHLFKTYTSIENTVDISLGIKCMEWNPLTAVLAIGDYNENVTILSRNTVGAPSPTTTLTLNERKFNPITIYRHPITINVSTATAWQEQLDASKHRSYIPTLQPASPPTSASLARQVSAGKQNSIPKHGISGMTFNADGTLLATKSDATPTTVWIWSLQSGAAVAVLIHHSPVKNFAWNPTERDLLLIHCAIPDPAIHFWKAGWDTPQVVRVPLERTGGRLEVSWLHSATDETCSLVISSAHQYAIAQISQLGELVAPRSWGFRAGAKSMGAGAEDMFDEGNSLDLSPVKISHGTVEILDEYGQADDESGSGFGLGEEFLDDTFRYRKQVQATS